MLPISIFHFSFNISSKAGLKVMDILNFCLFGKIFICPSFLKDSLLGKVADAFFCLISVLLRLSIEF